MASKSDSHNAATANQVATDFFQSWAVAEDANDVLTKGWVVAESDDRNPFYALYPNPTKAVIAQVASILKSSTSPEVVVGNKSYSRNMAIEWLITHASRIPAIRDAVQNPKIDEYSLLELIEEVYCDTQARSLAPEVREQLVENLMAANDQKAKQSQDAAGRTRLPTDHDLIELAKRNALIAYYKTTTIDPVAQNIAQSSQRLTEQANLNPQFAATLQTDAQIAAQSAAILTNTLTVNDFRTVPVEKTVEVITQQALAGTSLQNNPDAKKVLENTVRQQYQQRQQQVEQIHVSTQALAQELTTTANLTPQQSQQAAARFGEMVAAASTVQTKLDTVHTSRLLDQAVADVKAGATQAVTPVKVQTVLEDGTREASISTPKPTPINLTPQTQTAITEVAKTYTTANKEITAASEKLAQKVSAENNLSPLEAKKVVTRYNQLVTVVQTNPDTAQLATTHPESLLQTAIADVRAGMSAVPITPAIIKESIGLNTTLTTKPLSPDTQTALAQLAQVQDQVHAQQYDVQVKTTQALAQELTTTANLTPQQSQQAAARFGEMVAAASTVQTKLDTVHTSRLLDQAVADVKAGATQAVTPVKVQTVLEGGAKVIASPAISFSPDIKTAVQQVVHSQQAVTQSENVQKATLHAAQTIAQDLVDSEAIRPDQLTKVVNRYQEALQTATANGVTINPVQARQLLDQARIDVEEGKTTTPITQTQVNAVLQTSVPQAAPSLSSQSQSALDQLIQVHQQSKSEQLKVALEAKQSLTTHLINQGQVTVTEAPLVTQHYERLLQAAQALSPTPLSAQQTENLLAVAVEHVKSGQAPLETAQAVSTAQIGKINEALKPSTPTQENMPAAAQAAATKMVQAHESALPATDYISAQVAVSHDEIAKFYKDYGVTDVEAASHVAKVKELVSQGYTVQDAVLKAGGQDFEQRVQDSFNSHEELNEFVQRVDGLKPYVKTPDIDIYVGDKRLVIDRFRFKSSSETLSFDKALESINQVRLASGQGAITQRQLKLALIHQDTFQKLIADNPHLAGTIEQISADSTQIREFLRNNKDILQIKDGELLSQLVHDDNLIRFNPERGFNLFKSRVSGTIHEFNREARSIIDELKARITGKGVTTPIPEITDGEKPTAAPGQKLPAAKHSADTQPSTEMDTHLTDEYGNQVPLTGFRRILYPFKRFFQRLRASFFKTIGNWSQMGGVRGFVGRGVSWTLGKLGVKGFANNFVKGAASKVAKKVASKLAGKAAEKALGKLVGLLGPWGKVASVIIGLVGMENVKKILGAVAGLAGLIALAPLLWAAGVINAASAAVSKGVTAIKGALQSVLSGSSAAGGLTPAIANAPIIAVGATAVAGIFTMQQLSAVFMLPPYGTSDAFFNNQENLSSYSCPNENIPSSFPTGSPVEGYGWPITAGLNTSTGKSQHHNAVDIAPPLGTRVIATVDGYVLFAGWNNQGYGNLVILRSSDNAFTVYYAHLTNVFVQVNDTVVKNQTVIGSVGHTGNVIGGNGGDGTHLHYELRSSLYPNISLACGLGLSPEQVERLNGGCLSNCGTMP